MVAFIRINGLVEQRGRERERRLVKHISFGTEFLNHSPDVQRAPRDHRIMEHGSATEGMELIAEFAGPEMSFLPKTGKPRDRMGRLAFIQFTTDPAATLLIIQRLEDVHRLVDPADLRPTPDGYCSAGHADPVVGRMRETETIYRCGPPRRCIDARESWTSVLAQLSLFPKTTNRT